MSISHAMRYRGSSTVGPRLTEPNLHMLCLGCHIILEKGRKVMALSQCKDEIENSPLTTTAVISTISLYSRHVVTFFGGFSVV